MKPENKEKTTPKTTPTPTPQVIKTTKVNRLVNGALVIGKTHQSLDSLYIEDPYTIIPTETGLQMFAFDLDVLGTRLKTMRLDVNQVMYSQEPVQDLTNTYLSNLSGIELSTNNLIL